MKVAGDGFEQCYNAQAVVDTESMRVIATDVTQAGNDKEQVEPMVAKVLREHQNMRFAVFVT